MDMKVGDMTKALETRALAKSFGSVEVLKDINIDMQAGDFLVLVGPSGCGKSTLLNCIAGLEEITAGTLEIGGRDVTSVPPRDRDIAMVFQSYALYPTMSVAENIGFGMKVRRLDKATINSKVADVAKLLQIDHLLDRKPSQLSGGQRQRVAMGRALVREPSLFLFDEPLSNLDAKLRVEMRAEIKRLHQTTGSSIVYVTHDQIEAMTLATKIVVLKDGIVQQFGTPAEIYHKPANTFVADFMGSPPMNIVPARVDKKAKALLIEGQKPLSLDDLPAGLEDGADVLFGVRPEDFDIGGPIQEKPTLVENTGSDTFIYFEMAGKTVSARVSGKVTDVEETVCLSITPGAVCLFDAKTGALLG